MGLQGNLYLLFCGCKVPDLCPRSDNLLPFPLNGIKHFPVTLSQVPSCSPAKHMDNTVAWYKSKGIKGAGPDVGGDLVRMVHDCLVIYDMRIESLLKYWII